MANIGVKVICVAGVVFCLAFLFSNNVPGSASPETPSEKPLEYVEEPEQPLAMKVPDEGDGTFGWLWSLFRPSEEETSRKDHSNCVPPPVQSEEPSDGTPYAVCDGLCILAALFLFLESIRLLLFAHVNLFKRSPVGCVVPSNKREQEQELLRPDVPKKANEIVSETGKTGEDSSLADEDPSGSSKVVVMKSEVGGRCSTIVGERSLKTKSWTKSADLSTEYKSTHVVGLEGESSTEQSSHTEDGDRTMVGCSVDHFTRLRSQKTESQKKENVSTAKDVWVCEDCQEELAEEADHLITKDMNQSQRNTFNLINTVLGYTQLCFSPAEVQFFLSCLQKRRLVSGQGVCLCCGVALRRGKRSSAQKINLPTIAGDGVFKRLSNQRP